MTRLTRTALALAGLMAFGTAAHAADGFAAPGKSWTISHASGWTARLTRIGDGNPKDETGFSEFKARFKRPTETSFAARVEARITDEGVITAIRYDLNEQGMERVCLYGGKLTDEKPSDPRHAAGTVLCNDGDVSEAWSATIQ